MLEEVHRDEARSVCGLELYLGGFLDLLALELEQGGVLAMAEHTRKEDGGESLLVGVVGGDRIIEGLPRERHLVLSAGQLLLQVGHILVCLQVGVGLGEGEEPAQGAAQHPLGAGQAGDGAGVPGVRGATLEASHGGVTGLDDCVEGFLLVLHVALDRLDQVGDEVVPALQLDLDLGEGVLEAVLEGNETVVYPDHEKEEDESDPAEHAKYDDGSHDFFCFENLRGM